MGDDSHPVVGADPSLTNIIVIVKKPEVKKIKLAKKKPEQLEMKVIRKRSEPSSVIKSRNVATSTMKLVANL